MSQKLTTLCDVCEPPHQIMLKLDAFNKHDFLRITVFEMSATFPMNDIKIEFCI